MTKLLMTCGAAVLLAACASQPATTGSTSTPTAAPVAGTSAVAATAAQQGKLICEDSEQIGSHFHSRVCLTPEQVEARKKAARDMMQNSQTGMCASSSCVNGGGGGPPQR
ncbi:MAG TPA: hypothetical protein VGV16_00115 [Gammaproteobacteria bacterium]|nr:hypothetical protein [Gammaproteobacteria bacterium]